MARADALILTGVRWMVDRIDALRFSDVEALARSDELVVCVRG
jgi:hypothetical protein